MAYIPNTWVVGDVITADKMNNIEQGIVDASQNSGTAFVTIKYSGWSGSHTASDHIGYMVLNDGEYDCMDEFIDPLVIYESPTFVKSIALPPQGGNLYAVYFSIYSNSEQFEGNIATTPVEVWWGSSSYNGYIISGDCTITLTP